MNPERVLLSDPGPLTRRVARWLVAGLTGRPMDLRATAVVVPTSGAARRLRAALVQEAAAQGTGLLPPLTCSPLGLLDRVAGSDGASRADRLLAWGEVLSRAPAEKFPALLGGFGDHRKPEVALRIAGSLLDVCALLGEAGWTPDAPEPAAACPLESDRWRELARLYRNYRNVLEAAGLTDPDAARSAAAREAHLPAGISRIVVAGVPDVNAVVQRYLENIPSVTVLIDAVAGDDESLYDAWGRPEPDRWSTALLPLTTDDILALADPETEAGSVARVLGGAGLCLADPELAEFHANALRDAGRTAFNPAGTPLTATEPAALATAWLDFCRTQDLGAVRVLLEQPAFVTALATACELPPDALLAALDHMRIDVLVSNLPDAQARWGEGEKAADRLVRTLAAWRKSCDAAADLARLEDFFQRVFGSHPLLPATREAAETVLGLVRARAESPFARSAARTEVFRQELAAAVLYHPHAADAVELHGWLEAPWLEEEALVVSGCTEGALPANVTGHPFLPDSVRASLGLTTNAARFARDVFLARSLLAARAPGRVKFSCARFGADGDPARPSRLLFRCEEDLLRERVRKLFAPAAAHRRPAAREVLWPLDVPLLPPPTGVSATAFGAYLDCPFRFYLSRVLKMDRFDPEKSELDALNFGDILHRAVEAFAKDPAAKNSTDAAVIESYVLAAADRELRSTCGTRLSLPVRVQRESLRARLRQFARIQADLRRDGWVIEEAEFPFGETEEIFLGGLRLRSRIDRVDRHEKSGVRRVVDYKTYRALAKNKPEDTHFGPSDGSLPEAETVWNGKPRRWAQLQLPVYRFLAQRQWPDDPAPPEVGYFVLPEKLDDSGVHLFPLDEPLFASAMACAEAVADRIRRGVFWPPREAKYDDFAALFADGDPADLVAPAGQAALLGV